MPHPDVGALQAQEPLELASSSNGRTSGKSWKDSKTATVRSMLSVGRKTRWEDRMARTRRDAAVKKLADEIKAEDAAEKQRRRTVTKERKAAAEERQRLEVAKAQMGARKAARLKKKMGRSKKVHG